MKIGSPLMGWKWAAIIVVLWLVSGVALATFFYWLFEIVWPR